MIDPQLGEVEAAVLDRWLERPRSRQDGVHSEMPDWLQELDVALQRWEAPEPPPDLVDRTALRVAMSTAQWGVTRNSYRRR